MSKRSTKIYKKCGINHKSVCVLGKKPIFEAHPYAVYLFTYAHDLQVWLQKQRHKMLRVGFVPTMGALHEGHLSLIDQAAQTYDLVVCSIFVNPTQFNDANDLAKYPRTPERDIDLLLGAGAHAVYLPEVSDIYPADQDPESFSFGRLETLLEGAHRPGHFAGVGMVVARLLRITEPDGLFLGEKDYQQCMIIASLLRQMHWEKRVKLHICPTQREKSGLAMSSRNMRLSEKGLETAAHIYQVMQSCRERYDHFSPEQLADWASHTLDALPDTRTEYVSFADAQTLEPIVAWNESLRVRVLVAVQVEGVRLIDNAALF